MVAVEIIYIHTLKKKNNSYSIFFMTFNHFIPLIKLITRSSVFATSTACIHFYDRFIIYIDLVMSLPKL